MTPAFDAEERQLALVHPGGAVHIHALDPAHREGDLRRVAEVGAGFSAIAFRPGRPHLALATNELTVRIVDARDGSSVAELAHPEPSLGFAWSPDGRILATECSDHQVRLWDVDSGKLAIPPWPGSGGTGSRSNSAATGRSCSPTNGR